MSDAAPMLADNTPTIATKADAPSGEGHESASGGESSSGATSSGEASGDAHGPSSTADAHGSSSSDAHGSSSEAAKTAATCPDSGTSPSKPTTEGLNDNIGTALATGCPSVESPTNAHGDALPVTKDANGKIVPLDVAEGDNSEAALLQRLGDRRAALDKREADLAMRESLVVAAEQKLDERTKQLQDLETKVAALVDEKQAAEDAGFKGIVAMYEQMKPKDAAKIFDTLNINVLLKIARAMNPRKVSPILAAMSSTPAQALTTALAMTDAPTDVAQAGGENLNALPQIVGH